MGEEVRLNFNCPKIQAKFKPQETEIKFVAYYLPLNIFFIFSISLSSCGCIFSIYWNELLLKIIFKLNKVDI